MYKEQLYVDSVPETVKEKSCVRSFVIAVSTGELDVTVKEVVTGWASSAPMV